MNPSTACATVLVDELVRHGVRHAVLCPGSRSAPLAFALHAADAAGRLELHVRTDERSAAFLALGLAGEGVPVPVVTTSGTAVANLHPAVLEAAHTNRPLLVLSADRPPELRGTGANQTTRQVGIFGGAPRWSHDLGTPDDRPGQVATWRATASRAVAAATGADGGAAGPVHLNLPFREPLVPTDGAFAEPLDGRPDGAPWTARAGRPATAVDPVADVPRTLVLVGDLPGPLASQGFAAADLAAARGWPLLAEPSSGAARRRALPHGPLLLGDAGWLGAHRPDRVLVVGRPTLSRPVSALLRDPAVRVEVVAPPGPWPDPSGRAAVVHPFAALVVDGPAHVDADWLAGWRQAARAVAEAVRPAVAGSWPSGTAVAAALLAALPAGAQLLAGSSNAVRELDLAGPGGDVDVVANRGLAGIDGCVSTAAGLALASGRPTYALLGDLTLVHDLAGLVSGPLERRPDLTVVLVDDDGGGIFGLLEPGAPQHVQAFERVFGTPLGLDLRALCEGAGARWTTASTPEQLTTAVAEPPRGTQVVAVRVPREGQRALHERLRRLAGAALTG